MLNATSISPLPADPGEVSSHACAGHLVQFYKQLDYLAISVAEYIRIGLSQNEGILVLATISHRDSIWQALDREENISSSCRGRGQIVFLDAQEVRNLIQSEEGLSLAPFLLLISSALDNLQKDFSKIRCYGELVDILASEGRIDDSIAIEETWNKILHERPGVSLLCGYSATHLREGDHAKKSHFQRVIAVHSELIEVESWEGNHSEESLYRKIAVLEQRAVASKFQSQEKRLLSDELQKAKVRLAQTGKLTVLGELCAGLAHELNNPLMIVKGSVHLVRQRLVVAEEAAFFPEVQNKLQKIDDASDRMAKIIKNVLTFARQEAYQYQNFAVDEALLKSVEMLRDSFSKSRIQLKLDLSSDAMSVYGDESMIVQVFMNILSNARDALDSRMSPGPKVIDITVHASKKEVLIALQDNGTGMSEETQTNVFFPFFTTKPVGSGTGLGLSISHGIISQHGGRIICESKLGQGTCFHIILPRAVPD